MLHMKFEFDWPGCFGEEDDWKDSVNNDNDDDNDDGRRSMGILTAQVSWNRKFINNKCYAKRLCYTLLKFKLSSFKNLNRGPVVLRTLTWDLVFEK